MYLFNSMHVLCIGNLHEVHIAYFVTYLLKISCVHLGLPHSFNLSMHFYGIDTDLAIFLYIFSTESFSTESFHTLLQEQVI